jgi:hypothetical protein
MGRFDPTILKRRRTDQDDLLNRPTTQPLILPPSPLRKRHKSPNARPLARMVGILLLIAAYVSSVYYLGSNRVRVAAETTLSRRIGREVHIGKLRAGLTLGSLSARDVTVDEDLRFGIGPFLRVPRVELSVGRLALVFLHRIRIQSIDLIEPEFPLIRNSLQVWNIDSILETQPDAGETATLRIRNGRLSIQAGGGEPLHLERVSADFTLCQDGAPCPFVVSAALPGGPLTVNGKAGPPVSQAGSTRIPFSAIVNAVNVDLASSHVLGGIAPALGGVVSLNAGLEWNGRLLAMRGDLKVSKLRLASRAAGAADTLPLTFSAEYDPASGSGSLTRCDLDLGKGAASISGGWSAAGEGVSAALEFTGRGVPATFVPVALDAISVPLPPHTALDGGIAFFDLKMEGPLASPRTAGSIALANTRLSGFNVAEALSPIAGFKKIQMPAATEIASLHATITAGGSGIAVERIAASIDGVGAITGSGSIGDDRILDFKLTATRAGESRPIPIAVSGPTSAPVFRPPGQW